MTSFRTRSSSIANFEFIPQGSVKNVGWRCISSKQSLAALKAFKERVIHRHMLSVMNQHPFKSTLHLVRFKQLPVFKRDTSHWALFLPYEDGKAPGSLFHITKESYVSWKTEYRTKHFTPRQSADLESILAISEINVTVAALDAACQRVTADREFNILTKNCHHWVCEVVEDLVRVNNLEEIDVNRRMRESGYKARVKRQ